MKRLFSSLFLCAALVSGASDAVIVCGDVEYYRGQEAQAHVPSWLWRIESSTGFLTGFSIAKGIVLSAAHGFLGEDGACEKPANVKLYKAGAHTNPIGVNALFLLPGRDLALLALSENAPDDGPFPNLKETSPRSAGYSYYPNERTLIGTGLAGKIEPNATNFWRMDLSCAKGVRTMEKICHYEPLSPSRENLSRGSLVIRVCSDEADTTSGDSGSPLLGSDGSVEGVCYSGACLTSCVNALMESKVHLDPEIQSALALQRAIEYGEQTIGKLPFHIQMGTATDEMIDAAYDPTASSSKDKAWFWDFLFCTTFIVFTGDVQEGIHTIKEYLQACRGEPAEDGSTLRSPEELAQRLTEEGWMFEPQHDVFFDALTGLKGDDDSLYGSAQDLST